MAKPSMDLIEYLRNVAADRAIASKLGGRVLAVGMGKQQGGVVSWLLLHC